MITIRISNPLVESIFFKTGKKPFSERNYHDKFNRYKADPAAQKYDLKLCQLPFLHHNVDKLLERIESLILRWVTFEGLLELAELVSHRVPGRYQVNYFNWEQVFQNAGTEDLYEEILMKI